MNKNRLKKYKKRMTEAIDNTDEEVGHLQCDGVLCDLLIELGYEEVVEIYDQQIRWFA